VAEGAMSIIDKSWSKTHSTF